MDASLSFSLSFTHKHTHIYIHSTHCVCHWSYMQVHLMTFYINQICCNVLHFRLLPSWLFHLPCALTLLFRSLPPVNNNINDRIVYLVLLHSILFQLLFFVSSCIRIAVVVIFISTYDVSHAQKAQEIQLFTFPWSRLFILLFSEPTHSISTRSPTNQYSHSPTNRQRTNARPIQLHTATTAKVFPIFNSSTAKPILTHTTTPPHSPNHNQRPSQPL